MRTPEFALTT